MRSVSAARLELERERESIPIDPVLGRRLPNRIDTFLKWLDQGAAADYTRFALAGALSQARRSQLPRGAAKTFRLMLDVLEAEDQIDPSDLEGERARLQRLEEAEEAQTFEPPQPSAARQRLSGLLGTAHDPRPIALDERVSGWISDFLRSFDRRRGPSHFARRLFRTELPAVLAELDDSQRLPGALPCLRLLVETLEAEDREYSRHLKRYRKWLELLENDARLA